MFIPWFIGLLNTLGNTFLYKWYKSYKLAANMHKYWWQLKEEKKSRLLKDLLYILAKAPCKTGHGSQKTSIKACEALTITLIYAYIFG